MSTAIETDLAAIDAYVMAQMRASGFLAWRLASCMVSGSSTCAASG